MSNIYELNGLIKDIKLNKDKVFEDIVEEYSNSIIRICYLQTGNLNESEDLAQEVFLKIYKNLDKFKGNSSIYTWIYKITINTCFSYLKKNGKIVKEELDSKIPNGEFTEEIVLNKYYREEIRWWLFNTPTDYRVPLYMFYFEDMKISQIAEVLECNENTVKTRLRRGKEFIKKCSEGEIYTEENSERVIIMNIVDKSSKINRCKYITSKDFTNVLFGV